MVAMVSFFFIRLDQFWAVKYNEITVITAIEISPTLADRQCYAMPKLLLVFIGGGATTSSLTCPVKL